MSAGSHGNSPLATPSSDPVSIRAELDAVLSSQLLSRPERLRRFLRFIVEETIAGRRVSEYAIAIEVYDRKESFDPATDAIVRTEVSRLRSKLAEYYRTEGSGRAFCLEVPARSYVPVFVGPQPMFCLQLTCRRPRNRRPCWRAHPVRRHGSRSDSSFWCLSLSLSFAGVH